MALGASWLVRAGSAALGVPCGAISTASVVGLVCRHTVYGLNRGRIDLTLALAGGLLDASLYRWARAGCPSFTGGG
mgnify:CR=1 FL=1|jgi:hypothetical protein